MEIMSVTGVFVIFIEKKFVVINFGSTKYPKRVSIENLVSNAKMTRVRISPIILLLFIGVFYIKHAFYLIALPVNYINDCMI